MLMKAIVSVFARDAKGITAYITGLLAQGYKQREACLLGVYLHGMAGDLAAEELGEESLIASDIIKYLPKAFLKVKK